MKSGIRIFRINGITAKGKLLPLSEFRPFREFKELKIDDEKAEAILKNAEAYLKEEIPLIPLSLFRDKYLTGNRSRYEEKHHHRRTMVLYMTMAELYEGKGRFIEKILDVVWAIMEESSWVIPAHMGNSLTLPNSSVPEIYDERAMPGLDLYSASCCATLATVKYFLGDKFDEISPVICKKIDHLIYLRGLRPFLSGSFWWMSSPCNWVTNIVNSILTATAYTVRDMDFREQLVDRAMSLLDEFTASYPEDGCCDEGPGYWGGAAGSLFDSLELLDDMSDGKITVWHEPIIKNMCEFITTMNIDGKYFVNFEDCSPKLPVNGDIIMRMGDKLDCEPLRCFGRVAAIGRIAPYHFFGMCYRTLKDAMSPAIKDAPSRITARVGTWLEGHKIAVFREFDDTSRGFFLATKGGTNFEHGNHNDIGCIVVACNGKPLVVDPGIGSYNNNYFGSNERYMRWFTNASYHSCPTVDGIDQKAGQYYSQNEVCDTERRCVSMDIAKAYPAEAGIKSLVRSSRLESGCITVTDEVKLEREGDIAFHFTCLNEPKEIEHGVIDIGEGVKMYYDKALALDIEKVENKCLPYDDLNFQSSWGVDNLWRVNLKVRAKEFTSVVKFV